MPIPLHKRCGALLVPALFSTLLGTTTQSLAQTQAQAQAQTQAQAPENAHCSLDNAGTQPSCQATQHGNVLVIESPARQVSQWHFDGGTHAYTLQLIGPDGALLRQWPAVNNGIQEIGWISTVAGRYQLRATPAHLPVTTTTPGTWTLQASGPNVRDDTVAPAATVFSPRLTQLQAQLVSATPEQHRALLQNFWRDAATQGTPLLESNPDNASEALVTFVWRAPADEAHLKHNIRIDWAMRSSDGNQFNHIAGTDIWYHSLTLPRGMRTAYQLMVNPAQWPTRSGKPTRIQRTLWQMISSQRDPLNPHVWHAGSPELPPQSSAAALAFRSALVIPEDGPLVNAAAAEPAETARLQGQLVHSRFSSPSLGNTRSLSYYEPAETPAASRLPLLILFDREAYLERVQIHRKLDFWIEQKRIPPIAMLLVSNPTRADRANELPPHSDAFAQMLATELLPLIRQQHPRIGRKASDVIVAGSSYGGLAAGYLGWAHSDVFGKVLSLSGSYWWAPSSQQPPSRLAEGDWLQREVAQSERRPVQWHLGFGLLERGVNGTGGIVDNNRHLRNVLTAKGYAVTTHEFAGGHDYFVWGDEILTGLQALLPKP